MPTSKKMMTKLNQVKKVKAEEPLEAGGCGERERQEEAQKAREETQVICWEFPARLIFFFQSHYKRIDHASDSRECAHQSALLP